MTIESNSAKVTHKTIRAQVFPGYYDRGTPLIVNENSRSTIIGMFQENLADGTGTSWKGIPISYKGPAVFNKITPETFNWIVNTADWTQDSSCHTYASCSCGVKGDGSR